METEAGFKGMIRTGYRHLSGFALGLVALFGGVELLKGGFYLGKHEGDAIHLADIVLRMGAGQWPHLDFMTPIGVLAAAPMALFTALGFGIGHAILLGQILVALLMIPPTVWVAESRLTGYWRHVFVGYVVVLCLAVVHGEANSAISISMHYNRWAWAISYLVLLVTILPPLHERHPLGEGVLIGLGTAALALIKMTYFVALAPVVLIGLVARRLWGSLAAAVLAGLAVMAVVTLLAGPAFWLAYIRDLATVALSTVRERPGEQFTMIIGGAAFIAPNLAMIAIVIVLRQIGRLTEGLVLFLLYFPFSYIVYQNFGNDPQLSEFRQRSAVDRSGAHLRCGALACRRRCQGLRPFGPEGDAGRGLRAAGCRCRVGPEHAFQPDPALRPVVGRRSAAVVGVGRERRHLRPGNAHDGAEDQRRG